MDSGPALARQPEAGIVIQLPDLSDLSGQELNQLLDNLKSSVKSVQTEVNRRREQRTCHPEADGRRQEPPSVQATSCGLTHQEVQRYSRQLILEEFGVDAQLRLSRCSKGALVVGAGGLGCPALQFLAAAGLKKIGIVDHDVVELSNLHRQILHSECRIGVPKAESALAALKDLNSDIQVTAYNVLLNSHNALAIVSDYDVVLDATDNVASRYLLNDACVLCGIPLVSGSALRMEGQLTVYNFQGGPTYRCLFPTPPPPETVTKCSDGGVLGVVPGIIGCLQALEALKILARFGEVLSGRMLLFDATMCSFRLIKLRSRNEAVVSSVQRLLDYEQFCGGPACDANQSVALLTSSVSDRLTVHQYEQQYLQHQVPHLLIDVRSKPECRIVALDGSINVPLNEIDKAQSLQLIQSQVSQKDSRHVMIVCRRGNDSQRAVLALRQHFPHLLIRDLVGGLHAWAKQLDSSIPLY